MLTPSVSPTWIALGLAFVASVQILLLTIVQGMLDARKERRTADLKRQEKLDDAALKQQERAEDNARQDLIAARAAAVAAQTAKAAGLLLSAQQETIARTDEVARLAAEAVSKINEQLTALDEQGKKIHILVNSDMTAARTNERDQTKLTLVALKRVQALSASLGLPIDPTELEAISAAEVRIVKLDNILADRLAAQRIVDHDQANPSP